VPCRRDTVRAPNTHRRWTAAAILALCLTSGCSSSESASDDAAATATPAVAAKFAPQVNLAGDERWLPLGAREFIDHSDLSWLGPCGADRLRAGRSMTPPTGFEYPLLSPASLSERPHVLPVRRQPGCVFSPDESFSTAEYTHPYDVRRADDIALNEGFFLDLISRARAGRRPDGRVPAYYESGRERFQGKPALRVTYWTLFGRHAPALPRPVRRQFTHEGDWERVAVLLRPTADGGLRPLAVRYYGAGRSYREVAWRKAPRVSDPKGGQATHPVVYSARGSHSLFPSVGRRSYAIEFAGGRKYTVTEVAPACPNCVRWRTWRLLRDARAEAWYGYGGAWGDSASYPDNAGPLGPSPYAHQTKQAARTGPNAPAP
jgi:hypothetical protein